MILNDRILLILFFNILKKESHGESVSVPFYNHGIKWLGNRRCYFMQVN